MNGFHVTKCDPRKKALPANILIDIGGWLAQFVNPMR